MSTSEIAESALPERPRQRLGWRERVGDAPGGDGSSGDDADWLRRRRADDPFAASAPEVAADATTPGDPADSQPANRGCYEQLPDAAALDFSRFLTPGVSESALSNAAVRTDVPSNAAARSGVPSNASQLAYRQLPEGSGFNFDSLHAVPSLYASGPSNATAGVPSNATAGVLSNVSQLPFRQLLPEGSSFKFVPSLLAGVPSNVTSGVLGNVSQLPFRQLLPEGSSFKFVPSLLAGVPSNVTSGVLGNGTGRNALRTGQVPARPTLQQARSGGVDFATFLAPKSSADRVLSNGGCHAMARVGNVDFASFLA